MKPIYQQQTFSAKPSVLYNFYMDAKKHAAITGGACKISKKVGMRFSAYDGYIIGKNLHIVPSKLIVQTWRGSNWKKNDPDSILMISFTPYKGGTHVELTHQGVPENEWKNLNQGWKDYYWKPWKSALK